MTRMRSKYFWIRAVGITIAVCAVTAAIGSLAERLIRRGIDDSKVGQISRGIEAVTPDIERRDREVEELTRL